MAAFLSPFANAPVLIGMEMDVLPSIEEWEATKRRSFLKDLVERLAYSPAIRLDRWRSQPLEEDECFGHRARRRSRDAVRHVEAAGVLATTTRSSRRNLHATFSSKVMTHVYDPSDE